MNNCMHCTDPGCTLGRQHLAKPQPASRVKDKRERNGTVWVALVVLAILAAPFTVPLLVWSVTTAFYVLGGIALACVIGPGLLLLAHKHL